jgi:hypothetical protein
MVYFKELSRHLSGRTEEHYEISLRIVSGLPESRTGHILSVSQKRYRVSQFAC